MTSVNKQCNAKDTKADEVCTNKCPNEKKHIHNRMIQSNAIQKQLNLEKLKSHNLSLKVATLGSWTMCDGNEYIIARPTDYKMNDEPQVHRVKALYDSPLI